jgi:peroxiredoxin
VTQKLKLFFALAALGTALNAGACAAAMEKPVYDKAEDVKPLQKGDAIPHGKLRTLDGKTVELKDLMAKKPSVLIFYRGGWCPYCNIQMGQLIEIEPKLSKLGYQVLAITPDKPESLKATMDKHPINYSLYSDSDFAVIQPFGLAYHVAPDLYARMQGFGVDLDKATGNDKHQLPVPAAYVVDTKGLIHFVYFNADIKVRVNPEELMKAAEGALK